MVDILFKDEEKQNYLKLKRFKIYLLIFIKDNIYNSNFKVKIIIT